MEEILYKTTLKPLWKGLLYLSAIFIATLTLDVLLGLYFNSNFIADNINPETPIWAVIIIAGLFLGSIGVIIYALFTELHITESGVIKKGVFKNSQLLFSEVDEVVCDKFLVTLKAGSSRASVGDLDSDFKEIIGFIRSKLKDEEDITVKGKEKYVKRFFPNRFKFIEVEADG